MTAPRQGKRKRKALTDYPFRTCQSRHDCCVCNEPIRLRQGYFDGGYGRRAHQNCAAQERGK